MEIGDEKLAAVPVSSIRLLFPSPAKVLTCHALGVEDLGGSHEASTNAAPKNKANVARKASVARKAKMGFNAEKIVRKFVPEIYVGTKNTLPCRAYKVFLRRVIAYVRCALCAVRCALCAVR